MGVRDDRVSEFHRLHATGCFVMPNPWDVGSARVLERMGFPALATTSAGLAWSLGLPDAEVGVEDALEHLRAVAGAVSVPVNADFQAGTPRSPRRRRERPRATDTGVAGLSIEDSSGDPDEPLLAFDLSVARVAAARRAIDESGTGVLLTGRSEGFVVGRPDLDETIRRLRAFAEAGADCLYAPRLTRLEDVIGDRRGGGPAAGEPARQQPVHDRLGGGRARRAPDQRRRHPRRARRGVGGSRPAQEIADEGTFSRFEALPDVEGLFGR